METHTQNVKVTRVQVAVAAGTDDSTDSDSVDMTGFDSVTFIAMFGTLTATQVTSIKASQSADDSSFADLLGSNTGPMADTDSDQALVLEITKPTDRYMRCTVVRATANAVIDGVIAIQTGPSSAPTTHDASSVAFAEQHASPIEGTA